jgi:polysaccharide export outer membrane protein
MKLIMGRVSKHLGIFCLFCLLAGLWGCKTVDALLQPEGVHEPVMAAQYWDGPRIGPGMALCIQIGDAMSEPKLMNVLVDQNGDITLPYLLQTPVGCEGLGLEALKQKLTKAYSVYIRQPQVTVTFGQYDVNTGVSPWGTVKVMGEVGNPGPVNMPPTMDLTVTKVLQLAGGVKPFGNKRAIVVTRCDKDGRQTRTRVDLDEIGKGGRSDKDMLLKAGDVIFVPETWY